VRTLVTLVAATRSSTPVVAASAGTERDNNRVGQRLVHQVMEVLLTNLGSTGSPLSECAVFAHAESYRSRRAHRVALRSTAALE
jgi:hypothetical protein